MTTFPEHKLAQYNGVCDMDGRFLLISSDDAMEQESFRDIFGSDLPYVKSDYSYFFIYQTEDITVYYGCEGTPYTDEDVDLLYFAESGNDQIYSPYFGSHLEESPVWGHEVYSSCDDTTVEVSGLVPFNDGGMGEAHTYYVLIGITNEPTPRLAYVGSYHATFWNATELRESVEYYEGEGNNKYHAAAYAQLLKFANQWGIK